jgi:hypothetical protein
MAHGIGGGDGCPPEAQALSLVKKGRELAMQQWGIRQLPDQEKLDMSHYSSDFLEL